MSNPFDDRIFKEMSDFLQTLLSDSAETEHHQRALHILRLYGIANGGPVPEGFTPDAQIVQEMVTDYIKSAVRAIDIGNYLGAREQLQRARRLLELIIDEQSRILVNKLWEQVEQKLQKLPYLSTNGKLPNT